MLSFIGPRAGKPSEAPGTASYRVNFVSGQGRGKRASGPMGPQLDTSVAQMPLKRLGNAVDTVLLAIRHRGRLPPKDRETQFVAREMNSLVV